VVKEALSAELNALILTKDPTAHPGTKDYLKLVQDCLTELIKGLSKKQLEDFADVANVRNTVGVEPGLKAKWVQQFISLFQFSSSASRQADKHFIGIAKKFTEDVYKQMGVKVFMLVGYQNTEGDLVRAKFVSPSWLHFTLLSHCQGGNGYIRTNQQAILSNLQKGW
jgi:hypothetical protein